LEGGRLQVEFSATSATELRALAGKLCETVASPSVAEIFGLLSGRPADENPE